VKAPQRPAEWLRPPRVRSDTVVLYLHGGGYVIGSPRSHRHLAAAIARAASAQALSLDYRLAPEHPFPAALDDAVAAYQPLLVQVGSEEVLLDDARGLAGRARAAGVDVTVEEWPAMIHVWHWFLPMLDEAERAIAVIGDFVRARVG